MACIMLVATFVLQAQTPEATTSQVNSPLSLGTVVSALILIYEAIIRLVPTVGNNSLVHSVIVILQSISDFLNVKKKI